MRYFALISLVGLLVCGCADKCQLPRFGDLDVGMAKSEASGKVCGMRAVSESQDQTQYRAVFASKREPALLGDGYMSVGLYPVLLTFDEEDRLIEKAVDEEEIKRQAGIEAAEHSYWYWRGYGYPYWRGYSHPYWRTGGWNYGYRYGLDDSYDW